LGFYKTGDFVLSPGFNFLNNKASYFGHSEKDNKSYFSFGASGLVIGGADRTRNNKKRSSAFALAINRMASFGGNLAYSGINNQSSYSQKFLEEISKNNDRSGNSVAQNYPFGTSLAFNTYWIDTVAGGTEGNFLFKTRAPIATGLIQRNVINTKGGLTELALAGAGNFNDKLYAGFTLAFPLLRYERESSFSEGDATENENNNFDYATINESLTTKGGGVNLKLGVIYKPVEYVRLGLAIHTPTFFQLTDKYSTEVVTNTEGYKGILNQNSDDMVGEGQFKYWHFTPYRIMVSGSYVLREVEDVRKQKGFITADIEFVNYKASSFTTDPDYDDQQSKDYLKSLNNTIDKAYKPAFNFKIGGELKFTTVMVRLGGAYYGNPYKNIAGEKGHRFQLTGGLGYRNKGIFVDLGYAHTMGKDVHFAYRLENGPFRAANIKNTGGNAVLTLGFKI
ncbi:MAG TPA: aromatic hydrocarbon degradation protein, partial [Chitinophagaceae bacterium]